MLRQSVVVSVASEWGGGANSWARDYAYFSALGSYTTCMQLDAGIVSVTSLSPLFPSLLPETHQAEFMPLEPCCRVTFLFPYRPLSVPTVSIFTSEFIGSHTPILRHKRRHAETSDFAQ